jgi:hypothetical protein
MTTTRTHKRTGWTRTALGCGHWRIVPTDESGERIVAMLSAGTWQNYPNDDRSKQSQDRVVLIDGPALPDWAMIWLNKANALSRDRARTALADMIERADWDEANRIFGD